MNLKQKVPATPRSLRLFLKNCMETIPTTFRSLDNYYHINGDTVEKQYKEKLSGYRGWSELSHAYEWLIFPENLGESICINETAHSNSELYTLVSNRESGR